MGSSGRAATRFMANSEGLKMPTKYKWLPSEPTDEMTKAWCANCHAWDLDAYKAMWQAAPVIEQDTLAYREAATLAKALFKKHYAKDEHYASGKGVWGLCDSIAGVISQIDNMVSCLELPQPKREPLSNDEIDEIWRSNEFVGDDGKLTINITKFIRAIEKAHGIGVE